ncbi:hypothetical protein [uncultured Lutibacter sp.]|uniref:hypothetical protein n=1 Tax=uncultured Lutibacter sp. TaxID=437739 RepID=UPI002625A1ED|nr:hypothetical protein [uncultured Lutibacter sp.]
MKKNYTSLFKIRNIVLTVFSLFIFNIIIGQNSNLIQVSESDFETGQLNRKSEKGSVVLSRSNNVEKNNNQRFFEIANAKVPTMYVDKGNVRKVSEGNKPIKLKSNDLQLNSLLNSKNEMFESVELIIVKLNQQSDLNKSINVSKLTEFKKLKYIFVKCNFECSSSQIQQVILNTNQDIIVYYIVTKQS